METGAPPPVPGDDPAPAAPGPLTIVLVYAAFAGAWILLSDRVLNSLFAAPARLALASTIKGWLFVAVTSALLYGLLRRRSGVIPAPPATVKKAPWSILAIIVAVVLALWGSGIHHVVGHQRDKELGRLQAIATMKAAQIGDWVAERHDDAQLLQFDEDLATHYRDWRRRGDGSTLARLQQHLEAARRAMGANAILLLDPRGEPVWGSAEASRDIAPALAAAAARAAATKQAVVAGPYRGRSGTVRLDFVAPLADAGDEPPVVVLQVSPAAYLFPTLQHWPLPSASGETVLFRRDDDGVLILNELRHRTDSAAALRVPLATRDMIGPRVLRGEAKAGTPIEGLDYRGTPTVGVVEAVPGTDWFLVAKMDREELLAEGQRDAFWIGLSGLLALFAAVVGVVIVWQRQQLAAAQRERSAQSEKMQALQLVDGIARSSTDAIFAKDIDDRFVLFNRAAETFVGKPAAEVLGQDESAIFPPELARQLIADNRRVMAENRAITFEEDLVSTRGIRTLLTTKGPIHDAAGKPVGMFGITRDITEIRRAETALRESEERLRLALATAGMGVWEWDLCTDGMIWSPECFEICRRAPGPVTLADMRAALHPDDAAAVLGAFEDAIGRGEAYRGEFRIVRADGAVRRVASVGEIRRDAEGLPLRMVGTVLDVTEAREVERALRESERRFHDVVTVSADWIWEVDAEGRYTYASDSVREVLGYGPEEVVGRLAFEFMPPEEAERVRAAFLAAAAAQAPFRDLDNLNLHKDGSLRHIQSAGMPIVAAGRLVGFRGLDRDVTRQKDAEARLRESEARLNEAQRIAHIGGWEFDLRSSVLRWSDEVFRIFEVPRDGGASYDTFLAAIHPDDRAMVRQAYEDSVRDQSPYEVVHRLLMQDGRIKHVRERGETQFGADGRPLRTVGTVQDITASQDAEEELRRRYSELERFNRAAIGRELDMVEMKKRINALSRELGRAPPYPLSFLDETDAGGSTVR